MRRIGILFLLLTLAGCEGLGGIFTPPMSGTPKVNNVTPGSSATNVSVGASVIASLDLPNGGINLTSVSDGSIRLIDTTTNATVPAKVSVLNEARTLTLDPSGQLEFGTTYRFEVTSGVTDASDTSFGDYNSTFTTVSADTPSVTDSRPGDGETGVAVDINIATDLNADGGVNGGTITPDSVYLVQLPGGSRVNGNLGDTGGGDSITFQPSTLAANTTYRLNITSAVTNLKGVAFAPYTATFTTGEGSGPSTGPLPNISLTPQPTAARTRYSSLAFDSSGNNLYATTIIGQIVRFPVSPDGSLGSPQTLTSVQGPDGGPRLTVGLTFDPASTDANPIVWVTHTALEGFSGNGNISNGVEAKWSGTLTRLSGPNLQTAQDYVVGLPRSSKDHVTNSIAFNPAEPGIVYFVQGSNTAMGAPDKNWLFREESVLSGAVLRLDTNLLGGNLPLNVQSEDGGNYNPYAPGAPLTVYASGTRNSYDLVWHSNGNLYVPANGSARGGNVPRYNPLPGTCENRPDGSYTGPMLDNPSDLQGYIATGPDGQKADGWVVNETLNDYLFKIEKGGYYGTPNPKRCEWILNGGGVGFPGFPETKVELYPSSVGADPNYRGPAGDFGKNISPDGAIEYKGNAFPALRGKLLVTRYSGFDDVVAVTLGSDGNAVGKPTPIVPTLSFTDPLDITQSPSTGYLYVSSYDAEGDQMNPQKAGITLLRPK